MKAALAAVRAAPGSMPSPLSAPHENSAPQPGSPNLACLNSDIALDEVTGALRSPKNGKADGCAGLKGQVLECSGLSSANNSSPVQHDLTQRTQTTWWQKGRVVNIFNLGMPRCVATFVLYLCCHFLDKLFSRILTTCLIQPRPIP
jgi:hypothetical protein